MKISLGYLKDCLAFIVFIISSIIIYLVKDINKLKIFILGFFIIGACIDGIFTFIPELHNNTFNE